MRLKEEMTLKGSMNRIIRLLFARLPTLVIFGCGCNGSFVKNELYRGQNLSDRQALILISSPFEQPDSLVFQKLNLKKDEFMLPEKFTSDFGFGVFKKLSHEWRKKIKLGYLTKITPDSSKQITKTVPDYNGSDKIKTIAFTVYSKSSFKGKPPDIAIYVQNGPITIDSLNPESSNGPRIFTANAIGYYIIWDYWRELPICYGRYTETLIDNEAKGKIRKINHVKFGEVASYPISFCLNL